VVSQLDCGRFDLTQLAKRLPVLQTNAHPPFEGNDRAHTPMRTCSPASIVALQRIQVLAVALASIIRKTRFKRHWGHSEEFPRCAITA
jgi:hypothetical protein